MVNCNVQCHTCQGYGHIYRQCPSGRFTIGPSTDVAVSVPLHATQNWVVYLGDSHHLTSDLDNLAIHSEYIGIDEVTIGNGNTLTISHLGSSIMSTPISFDIINILRVPHVFHNLLSVYTLT